MNDDLARLMSERRWAYHIPEQGFVEGRGFRVSVIIEGESGHFPTGDLNWEARDHQEPWFWGMTYHDAEQHAAEQNVKLGLDEKAVVEILMSTLRPPKAKREPKRSRRGTKR